MDKPEIEYPCLWSYRLIGTDGDKMKACVMNIMGVKDFSLEEANRKGKFISLKLEISVNSEEERETFFQLLKESEAIKIVL